MGDDDAAGLRRNHIGGIEADAEGGDDLQLLQPVDQIGVRALHAAGQNAADFQPDIVQQLVGVCRVDEVVQDEVLLQPFDQEWRQRRDLQQIDHG